MQHAAAVHRRHGCPVLLSGAGTPHKPPPLSAAGFPLHEATVLAAAALREGVPAAALLKETSSYDTQGNAFFACVQHAAPLRWRRTLLITSAFHMPRSRAAFEAAWRLAAADGLLPADAALTFAATPDEGLDAGVLAARSEREAASLAALHATLSRMSSLADFHRHLFSAHKCYAVARQHEWDEPGAGAAELSAAALRSY